MFSAESILVSVVAGKFRKFKMIISVWNCKVNFQPVIWFFKDSIFHFRSDIRVELPCNFRNRQVDGCCVWTWQQDDDANSRRYALEKPQSESMRRSQAWVARLGLLRFVLVLTAADDVIAPWTDVRKDRRLGENVNVFREAQLVHRAATSWKATLFNSRIAGNSIILMHC